MGIRKIKSEYQPTTYHFKHEKRVIPQHERAEFAANQLHLETKQWGQTQKTRIGRKHGPGSNPLPQRAPAGKFSIRRSGRPPSLR